MTGNPHKCRLNALPSWIWIVAALSICLFFVYLWTPLLGDDLAYKGVFSGATRRFGFERFPGWCREHWLFVNGRSIDKLMPVATNLPKGLLAGISAVMYGAMLTLAVRASKAVRGIMPWLLLTAMALALPWWDGCYLFAVQINYIWASVFVLAAYIIITEAPHRIHPVAAVAALGLCGFAGMSHEGASVPLLFGFAVYFALQHKKLNTVQAVMLATFAIGVILNMLSPGIRQRVGAIRESDDTPLWLLLKSEPLVLVLWAAIITGLFIPSVRRSITRLSTNPLSVLVYATLIGAPVILASGIVGRTGWFVTLYALVAVAGYGTMLLPRVGDVVSTVCAAAVGVLLTSQAIAEAVVQHRLYKEYQDYETQFVRSHDGIIRGSFTPDDALPWWMLNRLRGVPDSDDLYLLETLSGYYRNDSIAPVVIGPETRFRTVPPTEAVKTRFGRHTVYITADSVYTPCKSGFVASRRIIDPGDR